MNSRHRNLTIKVTCAPEAHTVALTGEADLLGAAKIEAALEDACAGEPWLVVVDLRNLTFIDSSGLHALIAGHERCVAQGHELRVIPGPANVQRLFELTGMNQLLPFTDADDLDATAVSPVTTTTPRIGA